MRIQRFACLAAVLASVSLVSAQGNAKRDALASGRPELLKLNGGLLVARENVARGRAVPAVALRQVAAHAERAPGKFQMLVGVTSLQPETLKALQRAGLEVVASHDQFGVKSVTVLATDLAQLEAAAAIPEVGAIQPEPMAQLNAGAVTSAGDQAQGTNTFRTARSVDGTGVRVGVLSDSIFDTRLGSGTAPGSFPGSYTGTTDQVTGDLPASVYVVDAGPGGGTDEGNGMAQIVHDVAPGSPISFASAFTSYAAFATNITTLASGPNPCKVICDDVQYYVEPMYQDGPIALAVNQAVTSNNVAYFSSAGNNSNNAAESQFRDSSATNDTVWPPNGNDMHDFDAGAGIDRFLNVSIPNNSRIVITLHWKDPYKTGGGLGSGPGASSDLDLYLTKNTTLPLVDTNSTPGSAVGSDNVIARSTDAQGPPFPNGNPVEFISYLNNTGSTINGFICVDWYDGAVPADVSVKVSGATMSEYTGSRTVYGHCAAANARAVAAAFACDINLGGAISPTAAIDPESFTAFGGNLPFYYDGAGATLAPSQTRPKPEITAPDGGNTTFFGQLTVFGAPGVACGEDDAFPNFFGTSAAAPHAAGAAALMFQATPASTPADVYTKMQSTATDITPSGVGFDFKTGYGLIAGGSLPVTASRFELE